MKKEISKIIKEWKEEAGVKGVVQICANYSSKKKLTICTDRPGLMIGYKGILVEKYKKKIQEILSNIESIEFVETDSWYIK